LKSPEWDIATCDPFAEIIAPALGHPHVVIDLSAVKYMDSTCLAKLAEMCRERVVKNGYPPSHLVIGEPAISRLFTIAKFDRLWPINSTVDEALAAILLSVKLRASQQERTLP
jgi:anti-anti-sigma factor